MRLEATAHARRIARHAARVPGAQGHGGAAAGGHGKRRPRLDARRGRVRSRSAARRASAWARARRGPRPVATSSRRGSRPEPGKRHGIGDPDAAGGGREGRLQHVGVRHVAPVRLGGVLGTQLEAAAAVGVEERAEDAGRVEIGQAPPVDRAASAPPARRCGRRRSGHSRAGAGSVQEGRGSTRLHSTVDRARAQAIEPEASMSFWCSLRPPATP